MTKQLTRRTDDAEAGAFIGFDSSNESDVSEEEVWYFYVLFVCYTYVLTYMAVTCMANVNLLFIF